MYNANNTRKLRSIVEELKQGESIYINAINISTGAIDQLRQYIKDDVLTPDAYEVKRRYKKPEDVMSGDVIFPQMTYIKQ